MIQMFPNSKINFIGQRKFAYILSSVIIIAGIISMIARPNGFNLAIDFVGGTVLQLKFEKPVIGDIATIRAAVEELGYGSPEVKTIGPASNAEIQIIVKKKAQTSLVGDEIKRVITEKYPQNPFVLQREELVGPKVGGEMRKSALIAIAMGLLIIVLYVGVRFNLPFGVAGVVALFHDVAVTVSIFSFVGAEFSMTVLAALLTIVGFSINDTIVVFDRVRENIGNIKGHKSFEDIFNESYNQTLARTIVTSVLTFLSIVTTFVVFFPTGDVLKLFAGAMCVGIITGCYSTIYIAGALVVEWNKKWPIDPKLIMTGKKAAH